MRVDLTLSLVSVLYTSVNLSPGFHSSLRELLCMVDHIMDNKKVLNALYMDSNHAEYH
jgi:hypothetical protein